MDENVVQLANFQRPPQASNDDSAEAPAASSAARRRQLEAAGRVATAVIGHILTALGNTLRYTTFFVLRFLRLPLRFALGLTAGGGFLAFIVILIGLHGDQKPVYIAYTLGVALAASIIRYLYDWLLVVLAPTREVAI